MNGIQAYIFGSQKASFNRWSLWVKKYSTQRVSALFRPTNVVPKDAKVKTSDITSKSQKLMTDMGIIKSEGPGLFTILPLGLRSLEKLTKLLDAEMQKIGAQKLLLPTLTQGSLWKTTGRWESMNQELYTVKDRHDKDYVLSPTHEEAVTHLLATVTPLSYRQLPLMLYQISSKFRDEMKPRFGLLRGKEFIMKDLYSFDSDLDSAKKTYDVVGQAYERFYSHLGIRYVKVLGSSGTMGGDVSHEFHFPAEIGEDLLLSCESCGFGSNIDVVGDISTCPECKKNSLVKSNGIEVGHTFLLGTKYSRPLGAVYSSPEGKPQPFHMGCYGVGLSRTLAACLEALSTSTELRWPVSIAPFRVCLIGPKKGSKEALAGNSDVWKLGEAIEETPWCREEMLVDDRDGMTVGRRLMEATKMGVPYVVVLGKGAVGTQPMYELHCVTEGWRRDLSYEGIIGFFQQNFDGAEGVRSMSSRQ